MILIIFAVFGLVEMMVMLVSKGVVDTHSHTLTRTHTFGELDYDGQLNWICGLVPSRSNDDDHLFIERIKIHTHTHGFIFGLRSEIWLHHLEEAGKQMQSLSSHNKIIEMIIMMMMSHLTSHPLMDDQRIRAVHMDSR